MTTERQYQPDPQAQRVINELTDMVRRRYPTASFAVGSSPEDPEVTHIIATVDVDDPDEVVDLVIDRMLEAQIDEGIPVHLIPVRTSERLAALLKQQRQQSWSLPRVPVYPPRT